MNFEFRQVGAVAEVNMGTSPKGHFYNQVGEGMPLLNGPTQFGPIHPDVTMFTAKSLKQCEMGDLLFCVRGSTTGRMNWADQSYSIGRGICSIRGRNALETRFIRYALEFRLPALLQLAGGSTFPNLPTNTIKEFQIPYPDAREKIASILSAYDDLIENNLRRIKLLEESARLLYHEWFVRLRFPGHEHTRIVNGVPARRSVHQDDEMRQSFRHTGVPEGWKKTSLGNECGSIIDGDWIESKDQGGEDFRLVQISNIGINEFVETENYRFISEETFKRLRCTEIQENDILVARMPTPIGRGWLATKMPRRMVTAVDVAIIKPNPEKADPFLLIYYVNSAQTLNTCDGLAAGATRPRITRRNLMSLPFLLPPQRLQAEFREVAAPIHEMKATLRRQNDRLREARDILLPKLMSGEVEV